MRIAAMRMRRMQPRLRTSESGKALFGLGFYESLGSRPGGDADIVIAVIAILAFTEVSAASFIPLDRKRRRTEEM